MRGALTLGGINFGNGCYTFYSSRFKIFQPSEFVKHNLIYVLFLAGLIGIIPESGPHMILSHSVRVSFWVKMVNLVVGITIGYLLYRMGI
ncbi:MAG: hypothetical protein J7K17_00050 [Candidatus Omnitrophica bacterium]|nr:hypothetical protein [Candidatus Omnitrophota bacterium]